MPHQQRLLNRWRWSIGLNVVLLAICLSLFLYARNSDQNLRASQAASNKALTQTRVNQDAIIAAQQRSCERDNVLRQERNNETRIIQNILDEIVITTKERAALSEAQGNADEATLNRAAAKKYQDYRDQLKVVPLNQNCSIVIPAKG